MCGVQELTTRLFWVTAESLMFKWIESGVEYSISGRRVRLKDAAWRHMGKVAEALLFTVTSGKSDEILAPHTVHACHKHPPGAADS